MKAVGARLPAARHSPMLYLLPGKFSCCEVSGRLVFLDLVEDRYFCLHPAAEAAFRCTASISSRGASGQAAKETEHQVRAPVTRKVPTATESVLEQPARAVPSLTDTMGACAAILNARASLRRQGLADTVAKLEQRSAACSRSNGTSAVERISRAFLRADRFLSPLDQCLPRSIALASTLARQGIAVSLVVGVRLHPFLAHSWVQCGTLLLNDRPDVVRTFTPILVV